MPSLVKVLMVILCAETTVSEYFNDDLYLQEAAELQDFLMNERDGKSSYRKTLPPSVKVNIGLYFELLSLNDFDEIRGRFECNGMLRLNWSDQRFSWDPMKFNNTMLTPFMSSQVWKPQISLLNTFSKFIIINDKREEFVIWYTHEGLANLLIAGVFDVTCDPNVKYFPFDSHECVLLFIPFENLLFPEYASPFTIDIMEDSIIKDNFADRDDDGKWIYRTLTPCIVKLPSRQLTAVAFPVNIHRRPTFAIVNIILPVMLLGFLNLAVFFQPVQAGERISFSITVLLSFTVYMIYIGEIIPETSNPMPVLSFVLIFKLGCSTCIVIAVAIVTRIFHRERRKLSPLLRKMIAAFLKMGSCFSCKKHSDELTGEKQADDLSSIVESRGDNRDNQVGDAGHLKNESTDDWTKMCIVLDKLFFLFFLTLLLLESAFYILAYVVMSGDRENRQTQSQICTDGL